MRGIIITIVLVLLVSIGSVAQEIPSPADLWCFVCQPAARVSGPVRTLLSSVRRGENYFGSTARTYNPQGRIVDSLTYSFGNLLPDIKKIIDSGTTYTYMYDTNGRLVKESHSYMGNPNAVFITTYLYDDSGHLSEAGEFYSDRTLARKCTFTYEQETRTITIMTTFYENGRADKPHKTVLTYNDKGQWVKQAFYYWDGSSGDVREFSYNEKGDIAKTSDYDKDGKYLYADVFTYKYDSHGNWYEKHDMETNITHEGKLVEKPDWEVTFRVITYFDKK
jgi:antitoxin component YwqK of YwqJK toxin-antitoxin module